MTSFQVAFFNEDKFSLGQVFIEPQDSGGEMIIIPCLEEL